MSPNSSWMWATYSNVNEGLLTGAEMTQSPLQHCDSSQKLETCSTLHILLPAQQVGMPFPGSSSCFEFHWSLLLLAAQHIWECLRAVLMTLWRSLGNLVSFRNFLKYLNCLLQYLNESSSQHEWFYLGGKLLPKDCHVCIYVYVYPDVYTHVGSLPLSLSALFLWDIVFHWTWNLLMMC